MSKALVRARGIATPEQFKTDWSQFMKQNIAQNIMVYPLILAIDKSDAVIKINPAIPKAMIEKGDSGDKVYIAVCFKDDNNAWQCGVFNKTFADFATAGEFAGNDYFSLAASESLDISNFGVTALSSYDVHVVFSNKEINVEVAESVNDLPYVLYGPASEYIVSVEATA